MIDHSKADTGGLRHYFSLVAKSLVRISHNITGGGWGAAGEKWVAAQTGKILNQKPVRVFYCAVGEALMEVWARWFCLSLVYEGKN
jgi:hypothetical protein